MAKDMSFEVGSIAAFVKSGIFVPLLAMAISIAAVALGFAFFPLSEKGPMRDAVKRLAAGLFTSFTLGPTLTVIAIQQFPWYLEHLAKAFTGQNPLVIYLMAAVPFLAFCALIGFWLVGAVVKTAASTQGKTLTQIYHDAKKEISE